MRIFLAKIFWKSYHWSLGINANKLSFNVTIVEDEFIQSESLTVFSYIHTYIHTYIQASSVHWREDLFCTLSTSSSRWCNEDAYGDQWHQSGSWNNVDYCQSLPAMSIPVCNKILIEMMRRESATFTYMDSFFYIFLHKIKLNLKLI
jgi:hypothetical protein